MPKILAYFVRHGETDQSPAPEGWGQIPLNPLGRAQAADAGQFIKTQKILPTWGVSSDLARAMETLQICATAFDIRIVRPLAGLRAFDEKEETQAQFEAHSVKAIAAILATCAKSKTVALIASHRSVSAVLAKHYGYVKQDVDFRQASAVWEGGVIEINTLGIQPIYKMLSENPKEDLGQPDDGTHISGFVTAEENKPPRECGNCKWMVGSACHHPVVTADDELGMIYGKIRDKSGRWIVDSDDCCNSFQNKIGAL